jgi:hypothetical protein
MDSLVFKWNRLTVLSGSELHRVERKTNISRMVVASKQKRRCHDSKYLSSTHSYAILTSTIELNQMQDKEWSISNRIRWNQIQQTLL